MNASARMTTPPELLGAVPVELRAIRRRVSPRTASSSRREGEHPWRQSRRKTAHLSITKTWGNGQPIVFSHGWPLSADDWDAQMLFFGQHGHRVIAHDRRGHGRSTQTWDGNEMNTYADELRPSPRSLT
jgi:pimeloyl-ACP methyl ester carboxylesterase